MDHAAPRPGQRTGKPWWLRLLPPAGKPKPPAPPLADERIYFAPY
jgi:hypothetical protein